MMARATMAELLKYFLYLGSLGFGGPVALIGYMQRDLVEQRKWFSKDEYMKPLALPPPPPGRAGAARRPARHLPGLRALARARRHAGLARVHPAVVRDDRRHQLALR